jgi:hypothetical protein
VSELLSWVVYALTLAVGAYALVRILRDRPVDDPMFYGAAALEVLLVGQTIGAVVAMVVSDRDIESVTFLGYLLTSVIAPPAAIVWGISDKSRWGTAVVVVGMVTVAALQVRLLQLWGGTGA